MCIVYIFLTTGIKWWKNNTMYFYHNYPFLKNCFFNVNKRIKQKKLSKFNENVKNSKKSHDNEINVKLKSYT